MSIPKKTKINKQDGCLICREQIEDLEIKTIESGWFAVDKKIKFCPYCGGKI